MGLNGPAQWRGREKALLFALFSCLAFLACGDDNEESLADLVLEAVSEVAAVAKAGEPLPAPIVVRVTDAQGSTRSGVQVDFEVVAGGGSVQPASTLTGPDGLARATWTIGIVPVENRLAARTSHAAVEFSTQAELEAPLEPEAFGGVGEYMVSHGIDGSTEDLAFDSGGRLLLGVPGGLLALDPAANITAVPLSGDPLVRPLGIALDRRGNLWVADGGEPVLRRVSADGVVTTVLRESLVAPNFVAVDADGKVYVSDPCLSEILRYDPARGVVDATIPFDSPTQGSPNGFAFAADGSLYVATENPVLTCGTPGIGLGDRLAGVYRVQRSGDGFAPPVAVVAGFALVGDGITVDVEGNIYVVFETFGVGGLQSALWVVPRGTTQPVQFLQAPGRLFANPAFGTGPFGDTTLYITLIALPPLSSPEARGVERIEVGIRGLAEPLPGNGGY